MRKTLPIFLLIVEVILAVTFGYLSTVLPALPTAFSLQTGELFVLLLLYLCFGVNIYLLLQRLDLNKLFRICFSVVVLSIAMLLGAQISHPAFEVREVIQDQTQKEVQAVETGIKLGTEVTEQKLSPEDAKQQVNTQVPESKGQDIANRAIDLKTQGKSDEEIKQTLAPTIPLQLGTWTCVAIGCSYADPVSTWTISTQSRWIGLGFTAVSLGLLLLILNKDLIQRRK